MTVDEKDLQKLYLLIDKLARDANIVDSIPHRTMKDAMGLFLKELNRVRFVGKDQG